MKTLSIPLLLIFCAGVAASQPEATAGKEGFGTVIFCDDHTGISTRPDGVSRIFLPSNQAKWKAMEDRLADVGPAVAGSTAAIITESFNRIYGFSKETGKLLWRKEQHSNVLGSDGKYFYALRVEYPDRLTALRPDSGAEAWSLRVPQYRPPALYPDFLFIHGSLLFTDRFVVDLAKRAVVHRWAEYPYVYSIGVGEDGEILAGYSTGQIIIYNKNFKRLRAIDADGVIVEVAAAGDNIVAAVYGDRGGNPTGNTRGAIKLWTRDGEQRLQIALSSDAGLDLHPFTLLGRDLLIIEPASAGHKRRLTSRTLSTGGINWTSEDGDFFGPPVVCGDEVYVSEGDRIRVFAVSDGRARAPEPQLVAQGEYSLVQDGPGASPQPANTGRSGDPGASAELPLDHWFLYQMPDGTFKVDIEIKTVQAPGHAEEHLTFSKAMKRRTYEWRYEWKTKGEAQGKTKTAAFRCDFADAEARCAGTTVSGRTFSTSLAMQGPYSFMPITDEPLFDFPWAFQAMVWQVDRSSSSSRPSSIAMILFGDGATENGTVLQSLPGKFGLLRYLGKDTIEIAKQKVNAHKFEAKSAEHEDGVVYFWVSDSGLLMKMKGAGEGSPGTFVLSRYEGPAL